MIVNLDYFDFVLPTKIVFGSGKLGELTGEIKRYDFKKVAIVTNVADELSDTLSKLTTTLTDCGVSVEYFSDVVSNPHLETVAEGVREFADFQPDCLIGIGGGSALDCAKAIGLCLAHRTENITDLMDESDIEHTSIPTIEVPTTSGTGSEVDYWAVISDPENNQKLSIGHPEMSPHMAIVDPELTLTLPPGLTLWTGIDALTHAVEAYFSSSSNRLSDLLAVEAIRLVLKSLEKVIEDGQNLKARGDMSLASLLAGAAMQHVGLGLIHAISHQVSGFYDYNHGMTNAALLPEILSFNQPMIKPKFDRLDESIQGNLLASLDALYTKYDLREKKIQIKNAHIPIMAHRAAENVNAETNPRKATISDIKKIIRECFEVKPG